MTGRNFAKKTNIRFNYFGARTSRHGHEFLGPHSFFRPRARILRHNSADWPSPRAPTATPMQPLFARPRHSQMRFVSVETAISWFFIGRSLFLLLRCISGVAILPVAREKNSATGLLLEPKLELRV